MLRAFMGHPKTTEWWGVDCISDKQTQAIVVLLIQASMIPQFRLQQESPNASIRPLKVRCWSLCAPESPKMLMGSPELQKKQTLRKRGPFRARNDKNPPIESTMECSSRLQDSRRQKSTSTCDPGASQALPRKCRDRSCPSSQCAEVKKGLGFLYPL